MIRLHHTALRAKRGGVLTGKYLRDSPYAKKDMAVGVQGIFEGSIVECEGPLREYCSLSRFQVCHGFPAHMAERL